MQELVSLRWATDSSTQVGPGEDPDELLRTQDRELRELIKQDVDRTM